MKKAIAIGLLAFCSMASGSEHSFSNVQLDNLHYAYNFGEQFSKDAKFKKHEVRYDNNGLGYVMAAMSWQESSAGTIFVGKPNHAAYGIFQNYLPTVRNRVKQLGWQMSDKEIISMLKKRENSATWAYVELSYWLNVHNGDMRKALAGYNAGWDTKAGKVYASKVLEKANYLKSNKMLHITVE